MPRHVTLIAVSAGNHALEQGAAAIPVRFLDGVDADALLKDLRGLNTRKGRGLLLRLEQIRGDDGLPVLDLYLNTDADHPPGKNNYAGSMALYGLGDSTDAANSGMGQHRVFEAGPVFDRVRRLSNWSPEHFTLKLITHHRLPVDADLAIGRVALYYYEDGGTDVN